MRARSNNKSSAARTLAVAVIWLGLLGSAGATGEQRDFSTRLAAVPDRMERLDTSGSRGEFAVWLPRALAGDPAAAYRLGRAYFEGGRLRADFSEAAHWFRKAARAGYPPAQLDLAMLHAKGLGVPRDYVKAHAWFAAAADNRDYGLARDQALELRDMMAAFLTPEQRAEAKRRAAEWRAEAAR